MTNAREDMKKIASDLLGGGFITEDEAKRIEGSWRRVEVLRMLQADIETKGLKSIQMVTRTYNHEFCAKFLYIASERQRARLKAIADKYCESMTLVKETKTTLTFAL